MLDPPLAIVNASSQARPEPDELVDALLGSPAALQHPWLGVLYDGSARSTLQLPDLQELLAPPPAASDAGSSSSSSGGSSAPAAPPPPLEAAAAPGKKAGFGKGSVRAKLAKQRADKGSQAALAKVLQLVNYNCYGGRVRRRQRQLAARAAGPGRSGGGLCCRQMPAAQLGAPAGPRRTAAAAPCCCLQPPGVRAPTPRVGGGGTRPLGSAAGAARPCTSLLPPLPLTHVRTHACPSAPGDDHEDLAASVARGEEARGHVGLWPAFAMLNHSCIPNSMNFVLGSSMAVRAVKDIPAGQEVGAAPPTPPRCLAGQRWPAGGACQAPGLWQQAHPQGPACSSLCQGAGRPPPNGASPGGAGDSAAVPNSPRPPDTPLPRPQVTISYLGRPQLAPVAARVSALDSMYGFECSCERCLAEADSYDKVGG
jgi:hypothetical protein